jgi:hypothetical protein
LPVVRPRHLFYVTPDATDILTSSLRTDNIINIYICDNEKPFKVPASALAACSKTQYFTKALQHAALGRTPPNTLKFPDDNPDAFSMLLYFVTKRHLPSIHCGKLNLSDLATLVRAWFLGDKYDPVEFQHEVMFELLDY